MTPLRTRMLEDMQLKGYSQRTQQAYCNAVRQVAAHFRRSPDLLTEGDLPHYFPYLTREKKVARATATIAMRSVQVFFQSTLQRDWTSLALLRPAPDHRRPIVLTREAGRACRESSASRMPRSHLQAMRAIESCRTAALGGHVLA